MHLKKQIQKILFCLFLAGCVAAPFYSFHEDLKTKNHYKIPAHIVNVVSKRIHYDSTHHIEDRLPQTPEEILENFILQSYILDSNTLKDIQIILKQGEIIREDIKADSWWESDKIKDTLYYQLEITYLVSTKEFKSFQISGSAYVKINKRESLSEKQKQDAWLYKQMLSHLEREIQNQIESVQLIN